MSGHNLVGLDKKKKRWAYNLANFSRKKKKREKEGKKEKKRKGNLLLIFISLVVILGLVLFFWSLITNTFNEIFQEGSCSEFKESFYIEDACNLNENEVEVSLVRSSDKINLDIIKFEFQPSDSLWKVDGTKCLDVRLKENKYGNHCDLVKEEESSSYIFNLSLGEQISVKVFAEGDKRACKIGERKITNRC